MSKQCIINVAIGGWYPKGRERLVRSLMYHGFAGEVLTWNNDWPNGNYDGSCLYDVKAAALEEAIARGFTHIFWADCSMWCVRDPQALFGIIDEKGVYLESNGYNCAQECSDDCLDYFEVTRDEAEKIPMCSSGLLGININNPKGKEFAELWIESAKNRVWHGSRGHDNQSSDSRFLHHRQDQSAASIIAHQLEIELVPLGTHFAYYPASQSNEKIFFLCRGM